MTPELFDFLKWCLNGLLVLVAGLSVNAYCERPTRQAQKLTAIGIGVLAGILAAWLNGLEVSQLQQQANSVYVSFGVTGGLSVLALAYLSPIFAQSQPGEAESSLRQGVLERVTKEVEDRRQDSLHQLDHIPLVGVRESASVPGILRPMQVAIQEKTRLLDESISQLFFQDDVAGQLLILGEPGSGKTTELLGLAQTLCQKAQADPQAPIPIIFEWSDWRPSAKSSAKSIEAASLNRWMVDQLQLKYGLDPKISQDWLHRNRLLPLLDGLDELQNFMTEAIVAINAMQEDKKEQHLWLTVCCRLRDYQACEETLNLKTRVTLKPLENKAIRDYLERRNASHLWPLLKDSPQGWLKLAKKPLLLDLMPRAYPAPDCPGQAGEEACRHRLFEDYSHRQLTQEDNWGYSEADSRRYLQRLAQILRRQGQTEFLIEEMQPDWLENPRQKRWFTWGSRLIFGLIFGLIVGLIVGLIFGLIVGLIFGLIFGLIGGEESNIYLTEAFDLSWSNIKRAIGYSLIVGLIFGLIV
ncbi:MAG: NACHT domain-containing protein, partial [Phormidium sp. BM_Day4_Bin.17]|nr:NACHT domain-containing protein [Phormidium sp. BM_Day4_Bin.17]